MTVRIDILGAHEAVALAGRLARAGDGRFKRDLYDAVADANRSVPTELRASALRYLPKRGGLAVDVARAHIKSRRFMAGNTVGIRFWVVHRYHIDGMDKGLVVHPLYGNKRHWYRQRVRPGWFTNVTQGQRGPTKRAIERAVERFDV